MTKTVSSKDDSREHVIEHVWPDWVENEEELDEDAAERQHTTHKNTGQGLRPETLLRDGSRDGVCTHRVLNHVLFESEVRSNKSERNWNAEPQTNKSAKGDEGDRSRASLAPQEDVEEEDYSENDTRAEEGCEEDIRVPSQSSEHLLTDTMKNLKTTLKRTSTTIKKQKPNFWRIFLLRSQTWVMN